jgi:nucleotide-binding universal stress UspA family protein
MSFKDLLLPLFSYPDPTPETALSAAAALARRLGGELTALALRVDIRAPRNRIANALIRLDQVARDEDARSEAQTRACLQAFTAAAAREGLVANALVQPVPLYLQGDCVAEHARTRDLTLLPIGPAVLPDVGVAEAVLFGSGRPVLVFSDSAALAGDARVETAAVAWDGGRAAARAVADALPVLKTASAVRIVVVTDEKPSTRSGAGDPLVRHLQAHGVEARVDEIAASGEPIGRVLRGYIQERSLDLLVMGGFGHSRAREFIVGGATADLLNDPPCPVLLAH